MRAVSRESLLDGVTLLAIAVVFYFVHVPTTFHGMPWGDPAWYFHFGNRVLHGAVPYKDFVFQVGPLPIFVDAFAQKVFGEGYRASLIAGLSVKLLRLVLTYFIVRRLASRWLAVGVVACFGFDRLWYSFANHWSGPYTQVSLLACTLFLVLAHQTPRRRSLYVGLAGASLGLMIGGRQSNAIFATGMFFIASLVATRRGPTWLSRPMLVRFWGGYAAALGVLALVLASMGALGPAVQQMLLDAPQKKNVSGIEPLLDAVTGGWATMPKYDKSLTLWTSFLRYQSLPLLVSVVVLVGLARPSLAPGLLLVGIPLAFFCAGPTSIAQLNLLSDLPRTFASLALAWLLIAPSSAARAFGVHRELLLPLFVLPLAMEWALELSFPGRGWGEGASLSSTMVILGAASKRVANTMKTAVFMLSAVVAGMTLRGYLMDGYNPFMKADYWEGTLADNHVVVDHQMLRGMKLNEGRSHFLAWLRSHVKPGDGCFVYGSMPPLYELLECKNPSMLDTTAGDFFTSTDGTRVITTLERNPPKWIIAQERHWMNPDLEMPFTGDEGIYAGLNPKASKVLHQGIRNLLPRYELLENSSTVLTPSELAWAEKSVDMLGHVRLYRLRD